MENSPFSYNSPTIVKTKLFNVPNDSYYSTPITFKRKIDHINPYLPPKKKNCTYSVIKDHVIKPFSFQKNIFSTNNYQQNFFINNSNNCYPNSPFNNQTFNSPNYLTQRAFTPSKRHILGAPIQIRKINDPNQPDNTLIQSFTPQYPYRFLSINDDIDNFAESTDTHILATEPIQSVPHKKINMIAREPYNPTNIIGKYINRDPNSNLFGVLIIPKRTIRCPNCFALMWIEEKTGGSLKSPLFGICCCKGTVTLPAQNPLPDYLLKLITENTVESQNFRKSFTSINAKYNKDLMRATSGVYTYQIRGGKVLFDLNPYVDIFQQLGKRWKEDPTLDLNLILNKNVLKKKTYNLPTTQEVAALIPNDEANKVSNELIVHGKDGTIKRVDEKYGYSDPLHYVLMLPRGEQGWEIGAFPKKTKKQKFKNIENIENDDSGSEEPEKSKYVTAMQYYAYQIHDRPDSSINLFGRLFHQYIVEQYAGKVEAGRLNYLNFNQKNIRAEMYQGMLDSIQSSDQINPENVGKKIVLPSSFTGSPRHMHQLYQDAMSVVRAFGKPDLFITMTCNPHWPEIKQELLESQTPNDRPDIIVRVFRIKLKMLIDDLIKNNVFGKAIAHVYVDNIVKAEIPDKNLFPTLHKIVTSCMMHGPCGPGYENSPCMVDGKCSKDFPKEYSEETILNSNTYPIYKRSIDNLDNKWVVPYMNEVFFR
ncbi:unnamed protein product [Brachionus calyciflorus]|uniref:Helitron helicase-like domain-containing protein n=1 Tax=Brachionus calyciflorus TaxID=104777 RepID=A0A814A9F7_9BILA|nr:unnamed protein product [Brachionus calyciflorus]